MFFFQTPPASISGCNYLQSSVEDYPPMTQDMLYCIVLYLAVGVETSAGEYILANVEDKKIDTEEQYNNIRFGDKDTVLSHQIILFSVGKITEEAQEAQVLLMAF